MTVLRDTARGKRIKSPHVEDIAKKVPIFYYDEPCGSKIKFLFKVSASAP